MVEYTFIRRQRDRVVLTAAYERADTVASLFQRFDMPVGEVVEPPPVGLRAR